MVLGEMATRVATWKVLKRAIRLSKHWKAANVEDTLTERNHMRKLIHDEYNKCNERSTEMDQDVLASVNDRLDMIEHYKTPFERPTHYAQHATIIDYQKMSRQKTILKRTKLN